jgi:hypothetical protein
VESVTPSARVIMRVMVSRGDMQFNEGWGRGMVFFTFQNCYISSTKYKTSFSVCVHIILNTDLTRDKIQNLLNDSPQSYHQVP